MSLNTTWFLLIAVLWVGYFILEGFDFGVGMLLKTVAKTQAERRTLLTTLGPVWDGNEVWLLVAGGATFAAFPEWYATLFSGFYLPLFLILVSLIVRGVAFEYRSKHGGTKWRNRWDNAIVVASFVPSLLWGVAFANIARGVPLERSSQGFIEYTGGFFNLLNPFAIVGGLVTLTLFATHGAFFIALKTEGTVRDRANQLAGRLGLATALLAVVFLGWLSLSYSDKSSVVVLSAVIVVAWLSALEANRRGREGWAFLYSAATSAMVVITLFTALYPYVMPSSVSPEFSLDIFNASSTNYTLKVMTYVAVVMTPLVLLYQAWTYWVFRKRISPSQIHNAESGVLDKINN
jgi:cytochrome d ubiquinol oxidase subunit II